MFGPLKRMKFLHHANSLLVINSVDCLKNNFVHLRTLKLTAQCKFCNGMFDGEPEKRKRKKTVPVPKITLEKHDGSTSIITLDEAAKLAKRHNMMLIKMPYIDTKGSRLVYKIVDHATYIRYSNTESQINPESDQNEKTNKSSKSFAVSSKITTHDLNTKLNNINKLLTKNHLVSIILNYSEKNKDKVDVEQYIKKNVNGILEKEQKRKDVTIFKYLPPENKNDDKNDS